MGCLAHCLLLDLPPESMQDHFCHIQGHFTWYKGQKVTVMYLSNVTPCFWLFLKPPAVASKQQKTSCFLVFCLRSSLLGNAYFLILKIPRHLNLKEKNIHLENYSDMDLTGSSLQILTASCHLVPV